MKKHIPSAFASVFIHNSSTVYRKEKRVRGQKTSDHCGRSRTLGGSMLRIATNPKADRLMRGAMESLRDRAKPFQSAIFCKAL